MCFKFSPATRCFQIISLLFILCGTHICKATSPFDPLSNRHSPLIRDNVGLWNMIYIPIPNLTPRIHRLCGLFRQGANVNLIIYSHICLLEPHFNGIPNIEVSSINYKFFFAFSWPIVKLKAYICVFICLKNIVKIWLKWIIFSIRRNILGLTKVTCFQLYPSQTS